MKVSVDLRGVMEAFQRAPDTMIDEIDRSLGTALTTIQREARRRHRFVSRSGTLARAVQVDFKTLRDPNGGIYMDTGIASYAPYVHEGTRPHVIKARDKAALCFIGKDGKKHLIPRNMGHAETRKFWRGVAIKIGAVLGYKGYVEHPGTKPDQFLYEAAALHEADISKAISRGIANAVVKLGLGK